MFIVKIQGKTNSLKNVIIHSIAHHPKKRTKRDKHLDIINNPINKKPKRKFKEIDE